ncbi:50S ribosomal protein L3 [Candidatus Micrarchaeota archaeon]|nr:50S ribosomal protein L3 [Candidatus Micrarchaeota archaeon]
MGDKGPRRGSIAYWHRKRSARLVPRMRSWSFAGKGLQGFLGYKAGMGQVLMIEDSDSPLKNQEVTKAVTVLETPPIFVYAITAYQNTNQGLKKIAEIPTMNAPKDLRRTLTVAKKSKMKVDDLHNHKLADVRVIVCTQPGKIGLKKTPEVAEIAVTGKDANEKLAYAKEILGKELKISDVFADGEVLDTVAITKGKGWQGVVKRFGVALGPHKATQRRRRGGSIGPETQGKVMYTIPRAGQMGYFRRTDSNKRILKISDVSKAKEVTPAGGFEEYGTLKSDYIVVEGSIPGPQKRVIMLRRNYGKLATKKADVRKLLFNSAQ